MSDFFDNIEDISVEKKEDNKCGYNVFTLRLDIENPVCELAYVDWDKLLHTNIKTAVYKDMDINFLIVDLSEHKPKSEYEVYEHMILEYKIFVYSVFTNVHDCCVFLDALNVQKGRFKNDMTHVIHYMGSDHCPMEDCHFSFDHLDCNLDEATGTSVTVTKINDIVCYMLNNFAAHPEKEVTRYFHFINRLIIKNILERHDKNMYYRICNDDFKKPDSVFPFITKANTYVNNYRKRTSQMFYIKRKFYRKSIKKLFSSFNAHIIITISLKSYFTKEINNTSLFRYRNQSSIEKPYQYFFKYISQLSRRTLSNNDSYYKFYTFSDSGDAMIIIYAGDMFVPEIDDIVLTSISIYGPYDSVIKVVEKIYE